MAHMYKKVSVTMKLPQLQNLIKRDPSGYKDEFLLQKRHFTSELDIFKLRPTQDSDRFTELIHFMSHVMPCYPSEATEISNVLIDLMDKHGAMLHPDVRSKLYQALVLLRNKEIIQPLVLIKLSFKLFSVLDKTLRVSLSEYIINDIKNINIVKNNDKLNRSIQAVLFSIVDEDTTIKARKSVEILAELYRKRIWTDARTVNVLAVACVSKSTSVMITAIKFFLGIETTMANDEEEEKQTGPKEVNYHEHSKKTKKRLKQVQKQVEKNDKLKRKQLAEDEDHKPLFPAIQLINDPLTLSEKLLARLRQSNEKFEIRLMILNFVSRLIGCHKLIVLNFYSFVQRYLTSHQKDVTLILTYLIQGTHDLVPPEDLFPVVKVLANNFITERCSNEVLAVGLNSFRELIIRAPSILREPDMDALVQDLAMYSKKMHKSVMIASKGVINAIRELYPALLKRADRGKFHNPNAKPVEYGQTVVNEGIDGAELLEAYERGEIRLDDDGNIVEGNDDEDGWSEVSGEDGEDGSDDDDDGWESVNSNDDEEDDEDEEDEEEEDGDEAPQLIDLSKVGNKRGRNKKDEEEEDEEEEEDDDDDDDGWESVNSNDDDDDDDDDDDNDEDDEEEDDDDEDEEDDDDEEDGKKEGSNNDDNSSGMDTGPTQSYKDNITNKVYAKRILTQDDFSLISRLKAAQAERLKDPRMRSKKGIVGFSTESNNFYAEAGDLNEDRDGAALDYSIDPTSLGPGMKTEKMTKIQKITRILEGRSESKFVHDGHAGGHTNKENLRKKNYVMVRRGKRDLQQKIKRSAGEQRFINKKHKEPFGRDKRKRRRV